MTPIWKAMSSGQIVSVDELESSMAGFIAQLKGKLTTQRYWYATMFVDQHSQYAYVYLQHAITKAETVQAKHSFECLAEDMGIRVHHYHADNGRFADKGFVEDCQKQHQGLTYCGVNAHFQNGIAEKKIHDLQEQTRTMMLHALCKCSSMLSIHLWPYGLHTANDICNSTLNKGSDISPIELFSGVAMRPKLKHYHFWLSYIHDCKVTIRVGNHVHRVSYHLVIQAPDPYGTINHGSRIRRTVLSIERPDTDHATDERGHQSRDRCKLRTSSCTLHSIRGQRRGNRARAAA